MTDNETELRALWTSQGVPPERQDELIADITAKAQPGARIGPFTIPHHIKTPAEVFMEWLQDSKGIKVYAEGEQLNLAGGSDHMVRILNSKGEFHIVTADFAASFGLQPTPPKYQKQQTAEQAGLFDTQKGMF